MWSVRSRLLDILENRKGAAPALETYAICVKRFTRDIKRLGGRISGRILREEEKKRKDKERCNVERSMTSMRNDASSIMPYWYVNI